MVMDNDLVRRFQRARESRAFWDAHYRDLLAQYPDQFIAVNDGEVVARARHIWDLVQDLEARGIDSRDTWITFLNATQRSLSV